MSVKGIIMFLGMNNTRLDRKILIILDFENGFLPTYLPQCIPSITCISKHSIFFKRLPRTSSLKMIDLWLIVTLCIPFFEIILHTKLEMIKQNIRRLKTEKEIGKIRNDRWVREDFNINLIEKYEKQLR